MEASKCPRCNSPNWFKDPEREYCLMCGYSTWLTIDNSILPNRMPHIIQDRRHIPSYVAQNGVEFQYTGKGRGRTWT